MPQSERVGWFEVYRCGCISDTVRRKRDLLGYCPKHGDDSRGPQRDLRFVDASAERATSCVWTDDEDGIYHTTCGGMFVLLADTPRQNGMNYCCYCGRTLTEADTQMEQPSRGDWA